MATGYVCSKCGHQTNERFCSECGTKVMQGEIVKPPPDTPSKKMAASLGVSALICVAILIWYCYGISRNFSSEHYLFILPIGIGLLSAVGLLGVLAYTFFKQTTIPSLLKKIVHRLYRVPMILFVVGYLSMSRVSYFFEYHYIFRGAGIIWQIVGLLMCIVPIVICRKYKGLFAFTENVPIPSKASSPVINSVEPVTGQERDAIVAKFSSVFASPSERFVCVLGNNFAESYIANGTLSSGFAILSDKRVYFKGMCFSKVGTKLTATNEERIVDVKDVTGTGFTHYSPVGLFLIGLFSLIGAFAAGVWTSYIKEVQRGDNTLAMLLTILLAAVAVGFIVVYFLMRKALFEISFAGGAIAFNVAIIGMKEAHTFQRNIRLVKDAYEEQREARQTAPVAVAAPSPQATGNIADELKKYKDLLDSGVISEDEYNGIKQKLISGI